MAVPWKWKQETSRYHHTQIHQQTFSELQRKQRWIAATGRSYPMECLLTAECRLIQPAPSAHIMFAAFMTEHRMPASVHQRILIFISTPTALLNTMESTPRLFPEQAPASQPL